MNDSLLVFADDWGRHPSSCQHLIGKLLERYQVLWINTIGTRAPRLNLDTLKRGLEKLRHWSRPARESECPENLQVCNPKMWPWFTGRLDRWLNRRLLTRQLTRRLQEFPTAPIAITTLPIVADLVGRLPVRHWVYYCVDDFSVWPGLDAEPLRRMEETLLQKVDQVIAVSETLRQKIRRHGREAELLTHGVDLDFWSHHEGSPPRSLDGLPRPLVVFWGVVDRRLDLEWLRRLTSQMTQGTLVLVGPENDPDPALADLPRTVRIGSVPFAELPAIAREASVLVMPYADLPVTRMIQPLKLKEYLAAGRPVVVRDLPATRAWSDAADVVSSADDFCDAVRCRMATDLPATQQFARRRLMSEGWADKAEAFEKWILESRQPVSACG